MKKIISISVIAIQALIILLFFFDNVITERYHYNKYIYETEYEARNSTSLDSVDMSDDGYTYKRSIFEAGNRSYCVQDDEKEWEEANLALGLWVYFAGAVLSIVVLVMYAIDKNIKLPKILEDKRKLIYSIILAGTNIAGIAFLIRMCNVYVNGTEIYQLDGWGYGAYEGYWCKFASFISLSGSFLVYLECFLMFLMIFLSLILFWKKNMNNVEIGRKKVSGYTDEIKKYKELLDEGIITQEEFDMKKKELLNL